MKTNSSKKILDIAAENEQVAYVDSKICVMAYDSESLDKAKSDFQLKKRTIENRGFHVTDILFTAILGIGTKDEWLDNSSGITSIRFAVDKDEPTESMVIVSDAFGDFGSHRWSLSEICEELEADVREDDSYGMIRFVKGIKPADLLYIYYVIYKEYWKSTHK